MTTHSPPLPASTPHLAHIHCALLPQKVNAFNEAMAALPSWPSRQPPAGSGKPAVQTVYGRRRLDWFSRHPNGFATELSSMPLIKQLAGSAWACTGSWHALSLGERGDAIGGASADARGRWGSMNDPTLGDEACPVYRCIFVDVRGQQHNVRVSSAHDELVAFAAHDMRAPLATCKPKK